MYSRKAWWQSKTILASIVTVICLIVGLSVGVDVEEADQTEMVEALSGIGALVSTIVAIASRYYAKERIGK